jgi:hypothetical protein
MAFGIPGSDTGNSNSEFLGRLQFDARSGLWKHVTRKNEGGQYFNDESEDYMNPSFLMDFGSFEVGYARISSPPAFLMTPYLGKATAYPQRPTELNPEGKMAFNPATRIKVLSPKTFGDSEPRYFMISSKTGMPAMEEAWQAFAAAPEAQEGKVPVVNATTRTIEVKTPQGMSKFKVPVFTFAQWVDRPAALGERITPIPARTAAPTPQPAPAPAPSVVNQMPPPAMAAAPAMMEPAPFAPEFR